MGDFLLDFTILNDNQLTAFFVKNKKLLNK